MMTKSHTDPELIIVTEHRVSCDGGGGALGHPKVFYELGEDGEVVCGYCGRHYVLKGSKADPTRN
ncbi:MAG: zinc-finger domain-containing protein [Pseudomonadota bacterium]